MLLALFALPLATALIAHVPEKEVSDQDSMNGEPFAAEESSDSKLILESSDTIPRQRNFKEVVSGKGRGKDTTKGKGKKVAQKKFDDNAVPSDEGLVPGQHTQIGKPAKPAKAAPAKHKTMTIKAGSQTCAPPNGELKMKNLGGSLLQEDDLPMFYLHEDFVDGEKNRMECFYQAKEATPGKDEFDFKLMPDTAEHMVDIWMIEQLSKHPKRTMDAAQAKLHFVAFPIFNSYASGRFWGCGNHEARIRQMVTRMTENFFYKQSQGKDFVVIATAPDAQRVFTPPLISLALRGEVIVATADKNYPSVEHFKRKVVIPYKAMHPLENAAWDNEPLPMAKDRNVSFMFHGDIKKGKRSVLTHFSKILPASDIQDHDFQHTGMNAFREVVKNSVRSYKQSKFCLVVEGSTPSSRRLFDSMASGCVPVLIGGEVGIKRNLPFQRTIDWSKIVYYGGDLDCVGKNFGTTGGFLKDLLVLPESEVDAKRARGFKVFKEALSYKGPGIVDALLRELIEDPMKSGAAMEKFLKNSKNAAVPKKA